MKQSDQGIVLHRIAYSESSLVVTSYTKGAGIQKFIFQGAKKKNHAVFPLSICELVFYKRPDSEMGKLTEATALFPLHQIVSNPIKSSIAFFIVDILKQTLHTNQSEPDVYNFLVDQIRSLNESTSVSYFPIQFLARFTEHIGIFPSLCDDPKYFNLIEGEFHSTFKTGEIEVHGEECQQLFRLFQGENPAPEFRKDMLEIVLHYYKIHTPRFDVTNSLEIIQETLYT